MKKLVTTVILMLFFGSSAYALGTPSFEVNDGDSSKGTLSMQELYIGGVKTHDNVKIEFDFKKSTFRLLEIVEADNSIPSGTIQEVTENGITVGLRRCITDSRTITCHLFITSNEFDRTIWWCGNSGQLYCGGSSNSFVYDNLGNQYKPSHLSVGNFEDPYYFTHLPLIADVTTEATIRFENISSKANGVSLLELLLVIESDDSKFKIQFRDISL